MYPRRLVRRVDQPALRQEAYVDTGRYPFLAFCYRLGLAGLFIGMPGSGDHTFMYAFVAYRILGGIGVGLASMVSPMYIAEVAPADRRGNLVAWNQFAIIFGMLVVYFK